MKTVLGLAGIFDSANSGVCIQEGDITSQISRDILTTAKEAAAVFRYIEQQINAMGAGAEQEAGEATGASAGEALVIGNDRYGRLFVTEPLSPYFSRLANVEVRAERISSFDLFDDMGAIPRISIGTRCLIAADRGDIFIVDGTKNSSSLVDIDGGKEVSICRFPDALQGYLNILEQMGAKYNTHFWAPNITPEVRLRRNFRPRHIEIGARHSVHLISSSLHAVFDDVETYLPRTFELRPAGYERRVFEQDFIKMIQHGIQAELINLGL